MYCTDHHVGVCGRVPVHVFQARQRRDCAQDPVPGTSRLYLYHTSWCICTIWRSCRRQTTRPYTFVPHVFICLYYLKIVSWVDPMPLYICTICLDIFVLCEDVAPGRPHVLLYLYHASLYIFTFLKVLWVHRSTDTYMQCHMWQVTQLSHKEKEELLSRLQAAMGQWILYRWWDTARCMYVWCICVCMYVYVCIYTHIYMCICICACVYDV